MTKKFTKSYHPVIVEWEDACSHSGRYVPEKNEDYGTMTCRSLGVLIESNRKEIKIGRDYFQDNEIRDIQTIPKSIVRKIIYLEDKNAHPKKL